MKVLIIGASGLVGSNCYRYFREKGWEVKGTYFSYAQDDLHYFNTLKIEDPNNFDVQHFAPNVIVHCGAMTHVDLCETEQEQSYLYTVQSTLNIIIVAEQVKAKLVYLSTDYVFDGKEGPYIETDVTNPISVYGKHKLEAEQAVLAYAKDHIVLRVTNIYGDEARGKNFVSRIVQQCQEGARLTLKLPYDQYASPTNAHDIARAMHCLLEDGKKGIYHIGGTDYMNRVELALHVLKFFPEAQYELQSLPTNELKQAAARPLRGGFVKDKFSSEYPSFLFSTVDEYVAKTILGK